MDSFDDLLDFLGAGTSRPAEASARNPLGASASSSASLAASTSDLLSASSSPSPASPDDVIMTILADAEHGYGGSNVHGCLYQADRQLSLILAVFTPANSLDPVQPADLTSF